MANIIYVLSNPAMPGLLKIGMTNQATVEGRMRELNSATGVPLPFDCEIAWELSDEISAAEAEAAFHTAFDPQRVNPSREFFQIEPEQVRAIVRLLSGRDVTPSTLDRSPDVEPEDEAAAVEFKHQVGLTKREEFLESVPSNERLVTERVLSLDQQEGVRIRWSGRAYNLEVTVRGMPIVVCRGYPSTTKRKGLYLSLWALSEYGGMAEEEVQRLEEGADQTGVFERTGQQQALVCRMHRAWTEADIQRLLEWLQSVIDVARPATVSLQRENDVNDDASD